MVCFLSWFMHISSSLLLVWSCQENLTFTFTFSAALYHFPICLNTLQWIEQRTESTVYVPRLGLWYKTKSMEMWAIELLKLWICLPLPSLIDFVPWSIYPLLCIWMTLSLPFLFFSFSYFSFCFNYILLGTVLYGAHCTHTNLLSILV